MTKSRSLFIIITTFGEVINTKKCIASLLNGNYIDFTIVVVDHGLESHSIDEFADDTSKIVFLRANSSLWWAGAMNVGIKAALENKADLIMFMNNDCSVLPNTIDNLINAVQSLTTPAVIAPLQTDDQGTVLVSRASYCFLLGFTTLMQPLKWPGSRPKRNLVTTRMIVGGRGALVPATVFDYVGLFDADRLPHYGADHDFYIRCQQQNVPLYVASNASVIVDQTSTSIAESAGRLSLPDFLHTLSDRKSHRNIRDVSALYKIYYPIKSLYLVGVGLNLGRYIFLYISKRLIFLLEKYFLQK